MVQPLVSFPERSGLAMGRTLTSCDRKTIKVTILNPTSNTNMLTRGEAVAIASPIESIVGAITDVSQGCNAVAAISQTSYEQLPDYLKDMVDRAGLTDEQRVKCAALICKYRSCFMSPDGPLGRTSVIRHKIDTGDAAPIKQRQR